MRINLIDLEQQINKPLLEAAHEIVRLSNEYDLRTPAPGKFLILSRKPDYHVEITQRSDATFQAICHCSPFKNTGICKHAVASLLILRDHLKQNRTAGKKQDKNTIEEILQKMSLQELRAFVADYASSHSALRSELLSNYIHLAKRPDYDKLFNDLAPIDKYGQVKFTRNSIKTIRSVSTNLINRARHLLKEKHYAETVELLGAVLSNLHKLHSKDHPFRELLLLELDHAYRVFQILCAQSMAPRLQQELAGIALRICRRERYIPPPSHLPLIGIAEEFLLQESDRLEAASIAREKSLSDGPSGKWIFLLLHWMRLWSIKIDHEAAVKIWETFPEVINEFVRHDAQEDLLFAIDWAGLKTFKGTVKRSILQAGIRSAKALGEKEKVEAFASTLASEFLDLDAWMILLEMAPTEARNVVRELVEKFEPGADKIADEFILEALGKLGKGMDLLNRIKSSADFSQMIVYDKWIEVKDRKALIEAYADHIRSIREQYGGLIARQKLNNIFGHLKETGLNQSVLDKIKQMDTTKSEPAEALIKGFVFDLDGVLVDTAIHHFNSWKTVMQELGAAIVEEDDHHTRGAGRMESLQYLLDKYEIVLSEQEKILLAEKKNRIYLKAIEQITPADLLPGAHEFLIGTKKLQLKIALGSASKNAKAVLQKLDIDEYFDAIVDGNDIRSSKPDPEIFRRACSELGLEPDNVVVFEDAPKGIQSALAAGCKAVGIGDAKNLSAAQLILRGLYEYTPSQVISRLI